MVLMAIQMKNFVYTIVVNRRIMEKPLGNPELLEENG